MWDEMWHGLYPSEWVVVAVTIVVSLGCLAALWIEHRSCALLRRSGEGWTKRSADSSPR